MGTGYRLAMVASRSSPTLRHMPLETLLLADGAAGITRAVHILRDGGLVAMPTETVYGLAGDARNDQAVARIFEAKGRPTFNPLIAHVADLDMARQIAILDDRAEALARAFWPGALTLVLPERPSSGLSPLVMAGNPTIAVRMPAHPQARRLIAAFGGPLAAPSANPSGKVSPTTVDHVRAGLGGRIEAILDGGPCTIGIESTIIGLEGEARLLRPGGITVEAIEAVIGPLAPLDQTGIVADRPSAPGQLASHYAPDAPVRLNATAALPGEIWVGFGPQCPGAALSLSPSGDLVEAAARLFSTLREADAIAGRGGRVAFAPIPEEGLGRAINDRLRRAAAPRP